MEPNLHRMRSSRGYDPRQYVDETELRQEHTTLYNKLTNTVRGGGVNTVRGNFNLIVTQRLV